MQNGFLPTVLLPTIVSNHSSTLIDHIYYSTPRNRKQFKCGNLLTDISDHFAKFLILYTNKNSKKKLKNRPMVRLFREQNKLKFQEILKMIDWDLEPGQRTTDEAMQIFYKEFQIAYNKAFPFVKLSQKELMTSHGFQLLWKLVSNRNINCTKNSSLIKHPTMKCIIKLIKIN